MSHQHSDYNVEHPIGPDCCVCCNNSPRSIELAQLDRYYENAKKNGYYCGILTPDVYELTKKEINDYYDNSECSNLKSVRFGPKIFSTIYQIELNSGMSGLRYST